MRFMHGHDTTGSGQRYKPRQLQPPALPWLYRR